MTNITVAKYTNGMFGTRYYATVDGKQLQQGCFTRLGAWLTGWRYAKAHRSDQSP